MQQARTDAGSEVARLLCVGSGRFNCTLVVQTACGKPGFSEASERLPSTSKCFKIRAEKAQMAGLVVKPFWLKLQKA